MNRGALNPELLRWGREPGGRPRVTICVYGSCR